MTDYDPSNPAAVNQAAVNLGVYDGLAAALHYIEQEEEE